VNAADCYEQLSLLCPEVDNYRLHYAQSLYKSNLFEEAMKVSSQIDSPEHLLSVSLGYRPIYLVTVFVGYTISIFFLTKPYSTFPVNYF